MISFHQASHDDLIFMQVPGRAADGGGPGTASAERIQKNAKHFFHGTALVPVFQLFAPIITRGIP